MKEKMERFVLPFSIGCVSQSSVAMGESQPKKEQTESSPTPRKGGGERLSTNGKTKNSLGFPPLPRPNFSAGLHKIIKSIKSLSQLFVVYDEEDEEREMEIGFPTDVQHVAHIGLDGFNNVSNMKSWDRGPEILSLPSLSSRQFELAMAAQTHGSLSQGHLQLP